VIEDRAAACELPIDIGGGEAASIRDVRLRDLARAVDSEKTFRFNEDACGLVLRVPAP
jgi:hypothetical protein